MVVRSEAVAAVVAGESYVSVSKSHDIPLTTLWRWVQRDTQPPARAVRLTAGIRTQIRRDVAFGRHSLRAIAKLYGVHVSTVAAYADPDLTMRRAVVAEVVDGASYVEVARRAGIAVSTAWRWAHADLAEPPPRRTPLDERRKRNIRRDIALGALSLCQIARKHGVHKSTVCKYRDSMPAGPWRVAERRCPGCGAIINTKVCVLCQLRKNHS